MSSGEKMRDVLTEVRYGLGSRDSSRGHQGLCSTGYEVPNTSTDLHPFSKSRLSVTDARMTESSAMQYRMRRGHPGHLRKERGRCEWEGVVVVVVASE